MDRDQFNEKFDTAFHNALHRSFAQIKLPDSDTILESWKVVQKRLASYRITEQVIEK